jgi:hypothetical protein
MAREVQLPVFRSRNCTESAGATTAGASTKMRSKAELNAVCRSCAICTSKREILSQPAPSSRYRTCARARTPQPTRSPGYCTRVAHFYVKGTGALWPRMYTDTVQQPPRRTLVNRMCGTSRNDTPPSTKTTNVGDSVGLGRCDVMPVAVARFLTCRPLISAKEAKELGRSAMKPAATHDGRLRGQGQKWDQRHGAGYVAWWTSCCRDTMAQDTMARDTLGAVHRDAHPICCLAKPTVLER